MTLDLIIAALIMVESSGKALAYNSSTDAVGILQIRRIMVDDVNRILGRHIYTYDDRWDPEKSRAMCRIAHAHYCTAARLGHEPTLEDYALCWFVGPTRARELHRTKQCLDYVARVRAALEEEALV